MYGAIQFEVANAGYALFTWWGPNLERARAARVRGTGNLLIISALLLPWSTAGTSVIIFASVVAFLTTITPRIFLRLYALPVGAVVVPLCGIALIGVLWAVDIPWPDRLRALAPLGKLLFIPALAYHFARSDRGRYVFFAFLLSCTILMVYSWIALYFPSLSISFKSDQPGVPIKNYIDQSQGFAFCAFALAGVAFDALKNGRKKLAILSASLAVALLINMAFVNVSRTALVYSPIIAVILAYRYLSGKQFWLSMLGMVLAVLGLWMVSPNLQHKARAAFFEYNERTTDRGPTSVGERLEYWSKSLKFIEAAPVFGHGTGSTKTLFERDAVGQNGLSALVIGNPHNQTLLTAIQWGIAGCVALYVMWITHLLIFCRPGLVAWIGFVAVVQNILSSIFNSHLTDFYQGWLYVFAVGIAAGTIDRLSLSRGTKKPPSENGKSFMFV
jgi:O-antigen ligase